MVAVAIEIYGRLDVLYNNATIQMSGRLVDTTEAMWDTTDRDEPVGIFWACRAAIPHMLEGGGGTIVNTSSTSVSRVPRVTRPTAQPRPG